MKEVQIFTTKDCNMKKLSSYCCAALCIACTSVAVAKPGIYVGIQGGYKTMNFPKETRLTDIFVGPTRFPNQNQVKSSYDNDFLGAYAGDLFSVMPNLQIGPQVGYSYYGRIKMKNLQPPNPLPGLLASGSITESFTSINLAAVINYDINKFFIRGLAGLNYMQGSISSDYRVDADSLAVSHLVKSSDNLDFAMGIGAGVYVIKNLSLGINYEHIFGKNYSGNDLNKTGDYPGDSGVDPSPEVLSFPAPAMNIYSAELAYTFS